MRSRKIASSATARWVLLLVTGLALAGVARAADRAPTAEPRLYFMAQADEDEGDDVEVRGGALEPRYQPREPEPKSWYNGSYIFGITRTIAASTMVPAAKVPLFVLSIPLDIAFFPFAVIGGLFG